MNAQSAVGAGAEHLVLQVLYQLIAILAVTAAVVQVTRQFGQTRVSGEILAGLLLGPSVLGALFPRLLHTVFDPSTSTAFVAIAQIGLVLLMFQVGLEFEFGARLGGAMRAIGLISFAGLAVPFAAGLATAPWFLAQLPEPRPPVLGFQLFFAIALSITAIPILGRIFMELGLSHTRTAALTIGAAAIDDVLGWLLLGLVALIAQGGSAPGWLLTRLAGLAVFVAVLGLVVRPLLRGAIARHLERRGELGNGMVGLLLLVLFASGAVTSNLGVFAIIGGFAIGVALHDDRRFVAEWKRRVSPLVNTLFLPVFFAFTGLRTDLGALGGAHEWTLCALVCLVAFASKFGGSFLAARLAGESARTSLTVGVCMNTRALMELVAVNIGYELGVLPRSMFTMLVLMAIASTFLATPLIRLLMRDERAPEAAHSAALNPLR